MLYFSAAIFMIRCNPAKFQVATKLEYKNIAFMGLYVNLGDAILLNGNEWRVVPENKRIELFPGDKHISLQERVKQQKG